MTRQGTLYQKILTKRQQIENPKLLDAEKEKDRQAKLLKEFEDNVSLIRAVKSTKQQDVRSAATQPAKTESHQNSSMSDYGRCDLKLSYQRHILED